jgi:hypothetical protein
MRIRTTPLFEEMSGHRIRPRPQAPLTSSWTYRKTSTTLGWIGSRSTNSTSSCRSHGGAWTRLHSLICSHHPCICRTCKTLAMTGQSAVRSLVPFRPAQTPSRIDGVDGLRGINAARFVNTTTQSYRIMDYTSPRASCDWWGNACPLVFFHIGHANAATRTRTMDLNACPFFDPAHLASLSLICSLEVSRWLGRTEASCAWSGAKDFYAGLVAVECFSRPPLVDFVSPRTQPCDGQ